MKFSRDFINTMDGSGRLLLAFNNVSMKKSMYVRMLEYIMNLQYCVYSYAPPETWQQHLFTVWWTVQTSEATDCQPRHPANCLLPSARRQSL